MSVKEPPPVMHSQGLGQSSCPLIADLIAVQLEGFQGCVGREHTGGGGGSLVADAVAAEI